MQKNCMFMLILVVLMSRFSGTMYEGKLKSLLTELVDPNRFVILHLSPANSAGDLIMLDKLTKVPRIIEVKSTKFEYKMYSQQDQYQNLLELNKYFPCYYFVYFLNFEWRWLSVSDVGSRKVIEYEDGDSLPSFLKLLEESGESSTPARSQETP